MNDLTINVFAAPEQTISDLLIVDLRWPSDLLKTYFRPYQLSYYPQVLSYRYNINYCLLRTENCTLDLHFREPGSSISIVSGYELDDRVIEVRFPAEAKEFFL
jgi:hypothetical protein